MNLVENAYATISRTVLTASTLVLSWFAYLEALKLVGIDLFPSATLLPSKDSTLSEENESEEEQWLLSWTEEEVMVDSDGVEVTNEDLVSEIAVLPASVKWEAAEATLKTRIDQALREELAKAVEREDYVAAASIKTELDGLTTEE